MTSRISATQAAHGFSELLDRVRFQGEEFIVERGGEPVCRISPIGPPQCTAADLVRLLQTLPKPDPGYWETLEELVRNQPPLPESPWER